MVVGQALCGESGSLGAWEPGSLGAWEPGQDEIGVSLSWEESGRVVQGKMTGCGCKIRSFWPTIAAPETGSSGVRPKRKSLDPY